MRRIQWAMLTLDATSSSFLQNNEQLPLVYRTYLSNIHFGHFATQSIAAIADLNTFKGLVLIPVLWWMWFQQDERREWRREMVLATLLSGVVALFVGRLLTHWLPFRVRPIYSAELHLHFAGSAIKDALLTSWSSFPSDHAILWMAVATRIFLLWRGIGVLAIAYTVLFICVPRATPAFTIQPICWGAALGIGITYVMTRCDPRALRDSGAGMDRTLPGPFSNAGLYSVPRTGYAVRRTAQAGERCAQHLMVAALRCGAGSVFGGGAAERVIFFGSAGVRDLLGLLAFVAFTQWCAYFMAGLSGGPALALHLVYMEVGRAAHRESINQRVSRCAGRRARRQPLGWLDAEPLYVVANAMAALLLLIPGWEYSVPSAQEERGDRSRG